MFFFNYIHVHATDGKFFIICNFLIEVEFATE